MFATKKLLAGGFAIALLATACGEDLPGTANVGNENVTIDGNEIELTSGLAAFDSCDALLTHLRTEGAERVGPWGFNQGNYWGNPEVMDGMFEDVMMTDDAMEEAPADTATDSSAPAAPSGDSAGEGQAPQEGEDFSGTNNQEAGVDEPDFVKTDGTRILTITNGRFTYIDTNDGTPVKRGSVIVGYETSDMLVAGDTVYLFSTIYGDGNGGFPVPEPMTVEPFGDESGNTDAEADFAEDGDVSIEDISIAPIPGPRGFQGPRARIVQIDISNADNPEVDFSKTTIPATAEVKTEHRAVFAFSTQHTGNFGVFRGSHHFTDVSLRDAFFFSDQQNVAGPCHDICPLVVAVANEWCERLFRNNFRKNDMLSRVSES